MRTRYTMINMLVNIGGQFFAMLLSFINRMVFIRCLSAAYLGVNGLFTDVLSILNFAELGIGTAMVFSMYEPAARDDERKLAQLMNLYKWMYRAVAVSVLLFGLVLLPFLPHFIKGGEEIEHITLIYIIYVLGSASSYLLSYKSSIYQAYQKGYIRAGWNMVCELLKTILQTTVLLLTGNFILYLVVQQVMQLLPNIMVSHRADNEFPYLKECHELPEKEERNGILKNIGAMSMHKLATVIVNNTDSLLMSSFIGLTAVGIYSNYRMVIINVQNIIVKLLSAFTGSVGNLSASEEPAKVYRIYREMDFMFFVLNAYFAAGMFILINPFIAIFFWRAVLLFHCDRGADHHKLFYHRSTQSQSDLPGRHGLVLERPLQGSCRVHHQSGGVPAVGETLWYCGHRGRYHHQHGDDLRMDRTLCSDEARHQGGLAGTAAALFCGVCAALRTDSGAFRSRVVCGIPFPNRSYRKISGGGHSVYHCFCGGDPAALPENGRIQLTESTLFCIGAEEIK